MSSLASEERRSWIGSQLRLSKSISLATAAQELGVSEMTVRRDLDHMESLGIARRVRGGAVYSGTVNFHGRERSHTSEKQSIAEKLLPLVPPSGVIAMDSSTTMYRLAQLITGGGDLVVITNGLLTFQALQERPGVTAILTGGEADRRSDSLVGPVATALLDGMRFSTFFVSTAAIDDRAIYEDTLEEADVKRAFARSSARVVLGAHSDKLGDRATSTAFTLDQVAVLATELEPDAGELAPYRAHVREIL